MISEHDPRNHTNKHEIDPLRVSGDFVDRSHLTWISLLRLNNADVMVSKLEVRRRRANLWHVAGNTILRGDFAGRSDTLRCDFAFHIGRLLFSRMAGEALLIVT